MLAELIENHPPTADRPQCFHARVTYVCSKATMIFVINLAGVWRDAASQMQFAATRNTRMRTPVAHIAINWSETEEPTDLEMINAARMVLSELGADGYQAVIGVHRDREGGHAHIVLNRIHPVTGKTLSLSNDFARLELACRRIEHHMGWPPDRGRFDTAVVNGEVELRPKPAAHWSLKTLARAQGVRPDGRAAIAYDQRTGAGYLRDRISEAVLAKVRATLDHARNWIGVHLGLTKTGLQYIPFRSGARIYQTATQHHMPAGQLGTEYGLRQMERRIGPYAPSMLALPVSRTLNRAGRRQKLEALKTGQAQEREALRVTLRGRRLPLAQALRAQMRDDHKAARRALKEKLRVPDTGPHSALLYPDTVRHRHAIRQRLSDVAPPDDHTARRQDWMLSVHRTDPYVPQIIMNLIEDHSETIRTDGEGDLLFARRDAGGGIAGFDRLSLRTTPPTHMPATSKGGLCVIGLQSAEVCIVVRRPLEALRWMLTHDGPTPLIIMTGDTLGRNDHAHLEAITSGHQCIIAVEPDADARGLLSQLTDLLPHAKVWKEDTDIPDKENGKQEKSERLSYIKNEGPDND